MTDYDKNFVLFFTPIMLLIALYEIKRGYSILHDKVYSPSLIEKLQKSLNRGMQSSSNSDVVIQDPIELDRRRRSGYYSIIGGALTIIIFGLLFFYSLSN